MPDTFNENEFAKIAYYYYRIGLTQDEIARRFSMSRQRVNRILKKCLETGVVTISIREFDNHNVELETQLEALTGLKEVVISSSEIEERNESLGAAASFYLERIIKDNDIIGFSRGRALSHLVASLSHVSRKNLTVTQLVGGLNAEETSTNSDDIVRETAQKLNAKPCFMFAPIIVENKQLRDSMLSQSFFSQVYETMKRCTVAFVGIGSFSSQAGFVDKGFLFEEEYRELMKRNAVGEISTFYFDIDGNMIQSGVNERVFAIDYDSFVKIPLRIGVAAGEEKVQAITGAIRSGLINVLITHLDTARTVSKAF
jgi:deoxyribonucleoside regulator